LAPIIDKTENWRKIPGFKGEFNTEGYIKVTFLEDASQIVYKDIENAPKRNKIKTLFGEIQHSSMAQLILREKFSDHAKNHTKPKSKKRPKNYHKQNKRRRINDRSDDEPVSSLHFPQHNNQYTQPQVLQPNPQHNLLAQENLQQPFESYQQTFSFYQPYQQDNTQYQDNFNKECFIDLTTIPMIPNILPQSYQQDNTQYQDNFYVFY